MAGIRDFSAADGISINTTVVILVMHFYRVPLAVPYWNGATYRRILRSILLGAVVDGPNADWYRQFLQDPSVHLPTGEWDLTASTAFFDGQGCSGPRFDMQVTVRVHVLE